MMDDQWWSMMDLNDHGFPQIDDAAKDHEEPMFRYPAW